MLACELRDHVGRQGARVCKRLVKMPDEVIHNIYKVGCQNELVMVRAKVPGRYPSVLELAVAVLVKAYRECFDRLVHDLRHQPDDRTRINAAREECP